MRFFSILAVLTACNSAKNDDTGEINDGDVNDTGVADDSDTGVPDGETMVNFMISGEWEGATLSLVQSTDFEEWSLGETIHSTLVTNSITEFSLAAPDPANLIQLDEAWPDTLFGFYMPALYIDSDGDGIHSEGEVVKGVGDWWLVYISGALPVELQAVGFTEGWSSINFATAEDSDISEMADLLDIEINAGLIVQDSITIGGSYSPVSDAIPSAEFTKLGVIPAGVLEDEQEVAEFLVDESMSDPWEISLNGAPADDHIFETDEGFSIALEVPFTYLDSDFSGGMSEDDTPLMTACGDDNQMVFLAYLPEVTNLLHGFYFNSNGFTTGWMALVDLEGEDPTVVTSDLTGLKFSDECEFEADSAESYDDYESGDSGDGVGDTDG